MNGWRLSGDVPLRVGQTCFLTVHLPNQLSLFVAGAIVRWVRDQEYGLETLVVDRQTQSGWNNSSNTSNRWPLRALNEQRPPKVRHHVPRRSHDFQHVGDCRPCGAVGTEGPLYQIRPLGHYHRVSPQESSCEDYRNCLPEPYIPTGTENTIIDDMLNIVYTNGLLGNLIHGRPLSPEKGAV